MRRQTSLLGFLLAMAVLGFLVQFQWLGYVVIIGYGLWALIKRKPAKTTFVLALLTLGMVPVAIVLANWLIAQNFAAYSFVLSVLGVLHMIIDLQREPRTRQ